MALPLLLIAGAIAPAEQTAGAVSAPAPLSAAKPQPSAPSPVPAAIQVSAQILPSVRIQFSGDARDRQDTRRQLSSPRRADGSVVIETVMIEFY